jgi:hypothetical protein
MHIYIFYNSIFTQFVIHVSMCYTPSSERDNFFQVSNDYWLGESYETQMHCLDRTLFILLQQQLIFAIGLCKETAFFQLCERISGSKIRNHLFIKLLYLGHASIHITSNPTAIFPLYEMSVKLFHFTALHISVLRNDQLVSPTPRPFMCLHDLHWFYLYWLGIGVNLLVVSHRVH